MTSIGTSTGTTPGTAPAADTAPEDGTAFDIAPAGDAASAAPRIAVRLFAGAAAEFGADSASVQAGTLGEMVEALLRDASVQAARVIERSSFLVNAVASTDRERRLADGDRVDVLPPFAGG